MLPPADGHLLQYDRNADQRHNRQQCARLDCDVHLAVDGLLPHPEVHVAEAASRKLCARPRAKTSGCLHSTLRTSVSGCCYHPKSSDNARLQAGPPSHARLKAAHLPLPSRPPRMMSSNGTLSSSSSDAARLSAAPAVICSTSHPTSPVKRHGRMTKDHSTYVF